MGEPHIDLESGLPDLRDIDLDDPSLLDNLVLMESLKQLRRDAEEPGQASAGFSSSI